MKKTKQNKTKNKSKNKTALRSLFMDQVHLSQGCRAITLNNYFPGSHLVVYNTGPLDY